MLADGGASITGQDLAAYVGAVAFILGGVWWIADRVIARPLDTKIDTAKQELSTRLDEQDTELAAVKQLATDANATATDTSVKLVDHMHREEVVMVTPWWRRHKARL